VNSAFFSVLNAVLLHPVPWKDPERIVSVWETHSKTSENDSLVSGSNFLDWRGQQQVFEQVAGWRFLYLNLTGRDEPERLQGLTVSSNYFPLLGVNAAIGRTFTSEEELPGHDKVVILSHRLWQRRFGSDPNVIGQQITVEGQAYTVVGVLPFDFRIFRVLNRELDVYIPLTLDRARLARNIIANDAEERGNSEQIMFVYARLKPGVLLEQAQAEMNTIYGRLERDHANSNSGVGVRLVPLPEQWNKQLRPTLLLLLGSVAFVLLIACANAANLLLARASVRRKEIAVRAALGASRLRIIRQLLTESVSMALLSGMTALLLAVWAIKLLNKLVSYTAINRVDEFQLDFSVLGFTLIISLLTGLIFGIAPALQSSRFDLTESLREGIGRATESLHAHRLRDLLVICELALAVVLLIGAGLLIRSVLSLHSVERGLNTDNVLTMQVFLPKVKYPTGDQVVSFYDQVLQRIRTQPGVESTSLINYPPLGLISPTVPLSIEGSAPTNEESPVVRYAVISSEYFNTMGIPLLSGRLFTEQDTDEKNGVVLISKSLAQRFWPNKDPVGLQLRPRFPQMKAFWVPESQNLRLTVVGVVGDLNQDGIMGAPEDHANRDQIYLPYRQNPSSIMHLLVRTRSEPLRFAAAIRSQVYAVDKDQPVFDLKTMEEVIAESFARPRILAQLLGAFAALALSLAAVGIYAVVSYSVTQRTHEIGIRVALGAQRRDILKLVVKHGMILTMIGMILGLLAALLLTRIMSSLLFGVGTTDLTTFTVVSLLLTGIALLASYLPARRATTVDPMIAMRSE
jgi:putative ABC transport system permease protein